MGFASGSDIFDPVARVVLSAPIDDTVKRAIIYELVDSLTNHDWDTYDESPYFDHPIVQSVFREIFPHWAEYDD